MKDRIEIILLLLLVLITANVCVLVKTQVQRGDMNGDGELTIIDLSILAAQISNAK
jgi:hypothetical protein